METQRRQNDGAVARSGKQKCRGFLGTGRNYITFISRLGASPGSVDGGSY